MATNSWRSGNGSGLWSVGANWFTLQTPGTTDTALLLGAGPYTVTIDAPVSVASVTLGAPGVTLDIDSTLALTGSVSAGISTDIGLVGIFAAGTLDLSGGGRLTAGGGTLEAAALLGESTTVDGAGTVTNAGSIGWSAIGPALIAITSDAFDNAASGQFVLAPIPQTQSNFFVTSVTSGRFGPQGVTSELTWTQNLVAAIDMSSADFTNAGLVEIDGGTLSVAGTEFHNSGSIGLLGINSQSVQVVGTVGAISIFGVVDTVLLGQLTVGADVATFDNTGTISAANIVFDRPMTLAQLGAINGGLTFDAGVDLGGGTLSRGGVGLGGLAQNGSIDGTGSLTLQAGATLENMGIGVGVQVVEPTSGNVLVVDPRSGAAPVTLDSVINELDFRTVASFDGGITLGAGASNDVVGVFTPGGVTLGAAFQFIDSVIDSIVTFGNAGGSVLNQGTWMVSGASLDVQTTLDGSGTMTVTNAGVVQVATLLGTGVFSLNDGALMNVLTLGGSATPAIAFGTGTSQLILPGTGSIGPVLSGLAIGDVVDFASVSSTPDEHGIFGDGAAAAEGGSLDIVGASGDSASVALDQDAAGLTFNVVPDGNGGSIVQVACFAAGTRIATADGEVPVESLRPGDLVRTRNGRMAPVRWVGCTRVDLARHPAPWRAAPIRIRADAFAGGQPRRDLFVSPEHCLLIDDVLVPAFALANGATVARADWLASVVYWHVELDRHDVLLAEGLPAESYLDTGNRGLFAGTAGVRALHPDFCGTPDAAALAVWAAHGCAPLQVAAPRQRAALRARAESLGWRLNGNAARSVLADVVAAPFGVSASTLAVRLPAGTARVRLQSRSFVPAEHDPDSGDVRRLGLPVASVCLGGWKLRPDALGAGWHVAAGEAWRWTDGDAEIAVPRQVRPSVLELRLVPLGRYWQPPEGRKGTNAKSRLIAVR